MSHKLLLADDSVTIQRVIELTFADEDIQLTAVGDGRQAIERIDADPPDIVLADVGMPEKDGYEVAAYIKNNPRLAHIPVLLLTGAFEPVDEARARAVGCDGVLAKPFEPQMVISRVKELLAGAARRKSGPRAMPPSVGAAAVHPLAPVTPAVPDAGPKPPAVDARPKTVTTSGGEMSAAEMFAEFDAMTFPVVAPAAVVDWVPSEPAGHDSVPVTDAVLDSTLRIKRRPTMVLPEFGVPPAAPTPPVEPPRNTAIDDYFERLDAAFTHLQSVPPVPPPPAPDEADWIPLAPERAPLDLAVLDAFPVDEPPAATRVAEPLSERPAPHVVPADEDVDEGLDEGVDERRRPAMAEAFSALLAAEGGEAEAVPLPSWFAPAPSPAVDVDDLVDRVTRQVLDQMTDRVVRDTVTDLVSRVAERLVREEIDRIKASII